MSKQQQPPRQPQNIIPKGITMKITKDQFTQQMMNSKRRISAAKGEYGDVLNDIITREFGGINMLVEQIIDQSDSLELRIKALELKLKTMGEYNSPDLKTQPKK